MLRLEWVGSTGVIPRPLRKPERNNHGVLFHRVSEVTGRPILPLPQSLNPQNSNPEKVGKALVTLPYLRMSMGGASCLPLGNPSDLLLSAISHNKIPRDLAHNCGP
ncbi:unnamed protein product [Spodoptera exigua]|nr:unnamed protein product [Spodoptera exigua]